MKKNVWILNHYAGGTLFNKGGRHYWIAKFLKQNGYEPTVFVSNAKNSEKAQIIDAEGLWSERTAEEIGVPYIYVKSKLYSGNGKDRILNMFSFYKNVQKAAKQYAKEHGKPDVIYASSVHPLTLVAGLKLAKYYGIKCICEVRDLWPESIIVYSKKWKKHKLLVKALYKGEKWIYKKADAMVFTMEGAYDYIIDKGWEKDIPRSKVYFINNGTDLERFDQNKQEFQTVDPDLDDENSFKIVYAGSIRKVNNIGKLLNIAKKVTNPHVKFLIWGNGDQLQKLKERREKEEINNVVFKGRVEKKYIPYITSKADLNFAHNDASHLMKYGISFNKLFDYLAAGKPILFDFDSKYNPAIEGNAGVAVKSGEESEIAASIDELSRKDKKELESICSNARSVASKYDFRVLTSKLISIIESI